MERVNQVFVNAFKAIGLDKGLKFHRGDPWDVYVPMIAANHNNTFSRRIGMSRNKLMYGQDLRLPIDMNVDVDLNPSDNEFTFYSNYVNNLTKIAQEIANDKLDIYDQKRKEYEDKKRKDLEFKIGDTVIFFRGYRAIGNKEKLKSKWEGPYRIIEIFNDGINFRLKKLKTWKGKEIVTNIHKIKAYKPRNREDSEDSETEGKEEEKQIIEIDRSDEELRHVDSEQNHLNEI